MTATATARVDVDVHVAPASIDAIAPRLSEFWRDYISGARVMLDGLAPAYPPGAPTTATDAARAAAAASPDGGPVVPDRYEALRERVLDVTHPDAVLLTCLTALEAYRNPYYAAALATAVNDWVAETFLDRDERLRALIAVPLDDPADAVAEIERRAGDRRFAGVLLPVRSDTPWGHKRHLALFEAAAAHGLPVTLHAWGRPASSPTPSGFTTTYIEDYVLNQTVAQMQLISLVTEGIFERLPQLRIVLAECGFAWLSPLLWRFDKDWKGVWREVPWVKERPSEYIYRHVRATSSPAHLPSDPAALARLHEITDLGRFLMYASDYPHEHGGGIERLLDQLDPAQRAAVMGGNAAQLYGLADPA